MSDASRLIAALLVAGAVAYTSWALELVLDTGVDPLRAYISDLAAANQPLGWLFRTGDLIAGLLVLLAVLMALTRFPRRPWATAGWVALALFGAATAVDSQLPLSCAPTSDAMCAAQQAAGRVPLISTAHAVSSTLAMAGALTAMIALTVAARRYGRWLPVANLGPVLVAAELIATGWTMAAVFAFEAWGTSWGLGAGQRLQVLLLAVWLVLLAVCAARQRPVPARETGRRMTFAQRSTA